jgi:hypothetical protein
MRHHTGRPFVYRSLFSYLTTFSVSAAMQQVLISWVGRAGHGRFLVVDHIDPVDVGDGQSSCCSVTAASRFLIDLVKDMCAPQASASTSSGCGYSRSRTRRGRAAAAPRRVCWSSARSCHVRRRCLARLASRLIPRLPRPGLLRLADVCLVRIPLQGPRRAAGTTGTRAVTFSIPAQRFEIARA